jgi:hypothetical protein
MFILVATMCLTVEAISCNNFIWQERTFTTLEECIDYIPSAVASTSGYASVIPSCFKVPVVPAGIMS